MTGGIGNWLSAWQSWQLTFAAHCLQLGLRSILARRLHCPDTTAVLTMYSARARAFDDDATQTASMLGLHAAVALERAVSRAQFRNAVESRQLIGQAVGILMEQDRLTPDAAFQPLSRTSQDRNIKLRELARIIVDTGVNPSDIRRRQLA